MSSFDGRILEIPNIAVDNFDRSDQQYYFLSHCHSDHLKGIESLQTDAPFFATPISAFIIKRKFPNLNIEELEIGYRKNLETIKDDGEALNFSVMALSAGHCMGACLFLFQIEGCDIIYTGDFRISLKNAKNLKPLKEVIEYGNLILYLDSTFMKTSYAKFPTQRNSIKAVIHLIAEHFEASSSHKVNLQGSARYGYERLLMEVSKFFKEKIYVCEEEVYQQYSQISEINNCITRDLLNSRIFLKPKYIPTNIIADENTRNVLNLNISAMFWANWQDGDLIINKIKDNYYRVCYATHNSLDEISDFLTYLKPKKVYLNVLPNNQKEKIEMLSLLKSIEKNYKGEHADNGKVTKRFSFKKLRTDDKRNGATLKKIKN